MTRIVTVGAAQLGPIARSDTRSQVVERLLALLSQAKGHGCDLVVFPELALTTFFARWYFEDPAELENRALDPRYRYVIRYLDEQLQDLRGCKGQTCRNWAPPWPQPPGV